MLLISQYLNGIYKISSSNIYLNEVNKIRERAKETTMGMIFKI